MKHLLALFAVLCVILVACAGANEPVEQAEITPVPTTEPADPPTPESIATPESTETPEPTETPERTETPEPTDTPTETPKPTNTPAPTSTPTNTPEPTPTQTPRLSLVIDADSLNIRSGPGTVYVVVSAGGQGEELEVMGQANSCQWLRVETSDGIDGWVTGSLDHVTLNAECGAIPASDIPPTPAAAPEIVASVQTWHDLPLMPGGSSGDDSGFRYIYMVNASFDEVRNFYRTEPVKLGWNIIIEIPYEPGILFGAIMLGREGCLANVTYESSAGDPSLSGIKLDTSC